MKTIPHTIPHRMDGKRRDDDSGPTAASLDLAGAGRRGLAV